MFHTVLVSRESVISTIHSSTDGTGTSNILLEDHLKLVQQQGSASTVTDQVTATTHDYTRRQNHPHSILAQPVFNRLKDETSSVSALLLAVIPWDRYVVGLLPDHVHGIHVVLRNSCNQSHTYKLDGSSVRVILQQCMVWSWSSCCSRCCCDSLLSSSHTFSCSKFLLCQATYLGPGELNIEDEWKHMEVAFSLSDHLHNETKYEEGHCTYTLSVYPSTEMSASWRTPLAFVFAIASAAVFGVTAILFSVYDRKVDIQNKTVIAIAARSNKLVSSLFPSNVRDRLLAGHNDVSDHGMLGDSQHDVAGIGGGAGGGADMQGTQTRIKDFLANDATGSDIEQTNDFMYNTKPIADLFVSRLSCIICAFFVFLMCNSHSNA
jgi:hypothetical protein